MTNQYYNPTVVAVPATTVRSAQFNNNNDSINQGFDKLPAPSDLFTDRQNFGTATSPTTNIYVLTINAAVVTALVDGAIVRFRAPAANTGPAQLNLNNLGLKQIRTQQNEALQANDIPMDANITVIYNQTGDFWQLDTSLTAVAQFAENAENSATAAAGSATAAAGSATSASTSATNAAASETAAAGSVTAAALSETNAAASATSAANSFDQINSIQTLAVLPWTQGTTATNPLQRYAFEFNLYIAPTASTSSPISLGASPIGDANWTSWSDPLRFFAYEETTTTAKTVFDVGQTIDSIADVYLDTNLQNTSAYSFTTGQQTVTFNQSVPSGTYVKIWVGRVKDAYVEELRSFRDQAETSATEAAGSATGASGSATAAAASATAASGSETNAATSETSAANSATAASQSETNAAGSSNTALSAAGSATASQTAAALSETNAATSETNAANSATAASGSATSASGSATTAQASATAAETAETNAQGSATAAAGSATSANTSANNAATSETNAGNSATAAAGSATAAAGNATSASTSATNAAASETAAATSETNAATSESNADTSAMNAQASATSASGSASSATMSAANAATSETNAGTSAGSASTSASSASTSATSAANSATAAAGSATSAANSATDAANSASVTFRAGGTFTPVAGTEYPSTSGLVSPTIFIITFPVATNTYTFTTGDLNGTTVRSQDQILYTPATTTFSFIPSSTAASVSSVNGMTGAVTITAAGLNALPNTVTINGVLVSSNPTFTATTTTVGMVELATSTETSTGTDTARAVTPAGLSARTATTSRTGLVELATVAETQAGTDANRAVTPATLNARTATETRTGIAEIATEAEVTAGTDNSRLVTPLRLAGRLAAILATYVQAAADTVFSGSNVYTGLNRFDGTVPDTLVNRGVHLGRRGNAAHIQLQSQSNANPFIDFARNLNVNFDMRIECNTANNLNITGGTLTIDSNTVWHQGNDGAGSGLDADLLDGVSGTQFARRDIENSYAGRQRFSGEAFFDGTVPATQNQRGVYIGRSGNGGHIQLTGNSNNNVWIDFARSVNTDFDMRIECIAANQLNIAGGDLLVAGSIVWTSGNDGSGSGLDADTVDGIQASSFLRRDLTQTSAVRQQTRIDSVSSETLRLANATSGWNFISVSAGTTANFWNKYFPHGI